MRRAGVFVVAILVSLAVFFLQTSGTQANFHCTRIHAIGGGFTGKTTSQYLELRMVIGGQGVLANHKIRFYDSAGMLKATFTFPSGTATSSAGDSVLIATKEFNDASIGGDSDFVFSDGSAGYPPANTVGSNGGDPLHPIQVPGGRVVWAFEPGDFDCNVVSTLPVDAVAYGGASGGFGSPAPALPSPATNDFRVLKLNNLNAKPSDNSAEYPTPLGTLATGTFTVADGNLVSDTTTPRNNANVVIFLPTGVGGIAGQPEVNRAPEQAPASSGMGAGTMAAIAAGAAIALVVALGAGLLVTKRRRVR